MPTLLSHEQNTQPQDAQMERALPDTWGEAVDMYRDQLASPLFIDSLKGAGEGRGTYETDAKIAEKIEEWVEDNREVFGDTLSTRLLLMAQAPLQVHHSEIIKGYKEARASGRYLPDDEWTHLNQCKLATVHYNQLLNNYMYEHQDESFGDVSMGLISPTLDTFPGYEDIVDHSLKNTLRGHGMNQ